MSKQLPIDQRTCHDSVSPEDEAAVRAEFDRARASLRRTLPATPVNGSETADWILLPRIYRILGEALCTGNWQSAKREVEALKRRTHIRIVRTR